jgi:hypothetical protein
MTASFLFLTGPLQGREIELSGARLEIGRNPDMDLVLAEEIVSRHQATLLIENGHCVLLDEGSTNGTFVNNRKVQKQVLRDGDEVEFGLGGPTARFTVLEAADAAPPTEIVQREGMQPDSVSGRPVASPDESSGKWVQEYFCPGCSVGYAIEAGEVRAGTSVYIEVDTSAVPPFCPTCGAALRSELSS